MPLALEPNQRFPIALRSDMDKPAGERPTFFVRSLSMREQVALSGDMDAALDYQKEVAEIVHGVCELVKRYLVDWENMGPHKFGETELRDLLTMSEARELLAKVMNSSYVQPDEKKS